MKHRIYRKGLFLVLGLLIGLADMARPVPVQAISAVDEKKLAEKLMVRLKARFTFINDPLINDYLNRVGQKIVAAWPAQPFVFQFYVINEPVYNAFAGPAGMIFINSGLFGDLESEEELAGILGHEIAHVTCRHISDRVKLSEKIGIGTVAGVIAAIGLGAAGAGPLAEAAMVGTLAAGRSAHLAFSREDEMQADQMGLVYLEKAGYGPEGLLAALQRIRSRQWLGADVVPTYLMTHPALEDRLAYVGSRLEAPRRKFSEIGNADFRLARNRLIALYDEKDRALERLEARFHKAPEALASQYGYGLILSRQGRYAEAWPYLQEALNARAFNPTMLTDLGRVHFMQGDYTQAARTLGSALNVSPAHPDALFWMARTRLARQDAREAQDLLQSLLAADDEYPEAEFYLAKAFDRQDVADKRHFHLGRYYRQKGALIEALEQFRMALVASTDAVLAAGIRKEIKEIRLKIRSDINE